MSYVVSPPVPFVATCGAEAFAESPDLEQLILDVEESVTGEDVVIWQGSRIHAVVREGQVFRLSLPVACSARDQAQEQPCQNPG